MPVGACGGAVVLGRPVLWLESSPSFVLSGEAEQGKRID